MTVTEADFSRAGTRRVGKRIGFMNQMRQEIKTIRKDGRVVGGWRLICLGGVPNFAQYTRRLSLMAGDPLGRTHDRERLRR